MRFTFKMSPQDFIEMQSLKQTNRYIPEEQMNIRNYCSAHLNVSSDPPAGWAQIQHTV